MLLPPSYVAVRFAPSRASRSVGSAPEKTTASSKFTRTTIRSPLRYAPSGVSDVTFTTRGGVPSTAMADEPPRDKGEPGAGRARLALTPDEPVTVPVPDRAPVPS